MILSKKTNDLFFKKIFIIPFLIVTLNASAQLSSGAIKDFAIFCTYQSKYGSPFFKSALRQSLSTYQLSEIALMMESVQTDIKSRTIIMKALYNIYGNHYERLFQLFYSNEVSAAHSKELANWIIDKNNQTNKN